MQPLHGHPADALALALRISSDRFDVPDRAPWPVAEPDQPRDRAGMADEIVPVADQHVHTTEGMVGVLRAKAITKRSFP